MTDTSTPRTDSVICPACAYQFSAISQDHQAALAALKHDIERQVQIAAELAGELERVMTLHKGLMAEADRRVEAVELQLHNNQVGSNELGKLLVAAEAALAKCFEETRERCAKEADSEAAYFDGAYGENSEGGESGRKIAEAIRALTNEHAAAQEKEHG